MRAVHARRCVYGEEIYRHPGVKTIPERLSGNGQDDPLALTSARFSAPASSPYHTARKYDMWYARCMDNLISLPEAVPAFQTEVFRTLGIF